MTKEEEKAFSEFKELERREIHSPVIFQGPGTPLKAPLFDPDRTRKLMDGAIDVHIHGAPDAYSPRTGDELEFAIQACQAGMGAVVFKSASEGGSRTAWLVQKVVNQWADEHNKRRIDVFGGVVLNYAVGGLNPEAVLVSARLGGRYVWMPNVDASYQYKFWDKPGGIDVLDEKGNMVPILKSIFSLIAEGDMVLGICHQTVKERFVLIDEAKKAGIKRIEIVHANSPVPHGMTVEEQKIAAEKGAYVGLYCFGLRVPLFDMDLALKVIKVVGPDHLVVGTDLGNIGEVMPVDAMRTFITRLLVAGIPDEDVEKMVKTNARTLLYEEVRL